MATVGQAYAKVRARLAVKAGKILPDTCRLIVGANEYPDTPCKLSGGSGDSDGAPYQIRFAWSSPAVVGAAAIIDAIEGREQLTLQLVGPLDSSTAIWQEWQATAGLVYGRADAGF